MTLLLGQRLGRRQHAQVVGRLARRGDHLVGVGRHFHHAVDHRVHGRRGFEIVVRNDDLRPSAELAQPVLRNLGGFDLHVDGMGAVAHRQVEDGELFFDAAVEFAVVLMAPAGGQQDAIGELFQKAWNGGGAGAGLSRKSRRNSRKISPAAASRRAWSSRVGTSGRPNAIQIRGSNLVCAIVEEHQNTTGGAVFRRKK